MTDVWIKVRTGTYCLIEGYDEFIAELKQVCPTQPRSRWKPAACTGLEMAIDMMVNHPVDWLIQLAIDGVAFNVLANLCKGVFASVKKLCERNNDSIWFETFRIEFDDITIVLEGVKGYPILLVEQVINQLPEALAELKKLGVDQVYSIRLPFYKTDNDDQPFGYCKEQDGDPIWWRICHDTNEVSHYCPTTKEYQ